MKKNTIAKHMLTTLLWITTFAVKDSGWNDWTDHRSLPSGWKSFWNSDDAAWYYAMSYPTALTAQQA